MYILKYRTCCLLYYQSSSLYLHSYELGITFTPSQDNSPQQRRLTLLVLVILKLEQESGSTQSILHSYPPVGHTTRALRHPNIPLQVTMQSLCAGQYSVADWQDCSPLQVIAHDLLSAQLKVELRHAVFPEHSKVQLPLVGQLNWV